MTGWNLPPGCTDRMVDEAFGGSEGRRGVYEVTVTRTSTTIVEVEAGSEEDARFDAVIAAKSVPEAQWESDFDTTDVEGPDDEEDPDDARDARIDYEMDRDR
jgi:hypothetical protein